jgi:hypothetical protein
MSKFYFVPKTSSKDSIKIFLLLSVFSVLLCSCSNDDDNKSKFLRKLVETAADGHRPQLCSSIMGRNRYYRWYWSRTDFNYTNGLITKIVTIDKAWGSKTLEYPIIPIS